jgi:chromosome segregation ATPase
LLKFTFDNEYSWFREKLLSYKVTVTPPSAKILLSGRRRRAKACHKAVQEDLKSAQERFKKATMQKTALALKLEQLQQELEQQKRQLEVLHKEEEWLKKRVELRTKQKKLLEERLTKGWNDEPAESSNGK